MLELEEDRERILASIPLLPDEWVPAATAAGRVLAESVDAPISLPCFDNSAMDGYAVRADDLKGASAGRPVSLSLRGESAAGKHAANPVEPGTSVRIFTGGPLPVGADAVVMQEDARPGPAKDVILFSEPVKPWENVRLCGEDVKRGAPLLSAGEVLNVGGVG